jgi:hypothetical protein
MMAMPEYPAPAKLNLFLHVVGRRPMATTCCRPCSASSITATAWQIDVRPDGAIRLLSPLPGVPPEQDLCWRAARLLQAHAGCRLGADIRLVKRLPLGGGLGGGSSDAATVLLALNRLWRLHLPRAELRALGLTPGRGCARVRVRSQRLRRGGGGGPHRLDAGAGQLCGSDAIGPCLHPGHLRPSGIDTKYALRHNRGPL